MVEPDVPQQSVVPPLVQEQLPITSQTGIDLPMLVEIRGKRPAARVTVEIKYGALSDVDE